MLEYEKASEQNKEILIYIADDDAACFPQNVVDHDPRARKRLAAFKQKLRDRHTVDTFSSPEDLAEKLTRDFGKRFLPLVAVESQQSAEEEEARFRETVEMLDAFRLTPKKYNGREIRLRVRFFGEVFPASRKLCHEFNLTYGYTVGGSITVIKPDPKQFAGLHYVFATGNKADVLMKAVQTRQADLFAQLLFTPEDVPRVHGEFLGRNYWDSGEEDYGDPREVYVPPEGKVILVFTKTA